MAGWSPSKATEGVTSLCGMAKAFNTMTSQLLYATSSWVWRSPLLLLTLQLDCYYELDTTTKNMCIAFPLRQG